MTWSEFYLARLVMAEERVGKYQREYDRAELETEQEGLALLRSRGLVG